MAAADFLLCREGLLGLAFVLDLALVTTDGALACRDNFAAGMALGPAALALELVAAEAEVVVVVAFLPDETATAAPVRFFDCPPTISGLVFGGVSVFSSALEMSLSAFRRAGFFRGFLVVVVGGLEGCCFFLLPISGLVVLALSDETGMIQAMLEGL